MSTPRQLTSPLEAAHVMGTAHDTSASSSSQDGEVSSPSPPQIKLLISFATGNQRTAPPLQILLSRDATAADAIEALHRRRIPSSANWGCDRVKLKGVVSHRQLCDEDVLLSSILPSFLLSESLMDDDCLVVEANEKRSYPSVTLTLKTQAADYDPNQPEAAVTSAASTASVAATEPTATQSCQRLPASESNRSRDFPDGSIAPKTVPRRDRDGLYVRPQGRCKKGMDWDDKWGRWIRCPGIRKEEGSGDAASNEQSLIKKSAAASSSTGTVKKLSWLWNESSIVSGKRKRTTTTKAPAGEAAAVKELSWTCKESSIVPGKRKRTKTTDVDLGAEQSTATKTEHRDPQIDSPTHNNSDEIDGFVEHNDGICYPVRFAKSSSKDPAKVGVIYIGYGSNVRSLSKSRILPVTDERLSDYEHALKVTKKRQKARAKKKKEERKMKSQRK